MINLDNYIVFCCCCWFFCSIWHHRLNCPLEHFRTRFTYTQQPTGLILNCYLLICDVKRQLIKSTWFILLNEDTFPYRVNQYAYCIVWLALWCYRWGGVEREGARHQYCCHCCYCCYHCRHCRRSRFHCRCHSWNIIVICSLLIVQ